MCGAILDKNVVHQVFPQKGRSQPQAGVEFHNAVQKGLQLVIGGHLLTELDENSNFRTWRATAITVGRVRIFDTTIVNQRTSELIEQEACVSDDEHVIALAQVSGARLLYSNDQQLHTDFRTKELVDKPRGNIYTTLRQEDFTSVHRGLLENPPPCAKEPVQGLGTR